MRELNLRFAGAEAENHELSATHLIRALDGLQRAYFLLAMQIEDVEVRQRERVTRDIEERYAIKVSPPTEGSVCFPLTLEEPSPGAVSDAFVASCEAIMQGDDRGLKRVVPDRTRRQRLLEALNKSMPRRGSGIGLTLLNAGGSELLNSTVMTRTLQQFLPRALSEIDKQTVTGELKAIAFDRRQLTLYYPVTQRELKCFYDEGAEEMLLTNPRELIQVTGTVVLDAEDQPIEIQDVQSVRAVDLNPFHLSEVDLPSGRFILSQPVSLEPYLDETKQLFLLEHEPLGIQLGAPSRDELWESLILELDMLWLAYAKQPDASLAPGAIELKNAVREFMREEPSAAR